MSFRKLDTSVDALVEEFESNWKPEVGHYSRKLVEYCSAKALSDVCCNIEEKINDGSFSRLSFDMMVAWEKPSSDDDDKSVSVSAYLPLQNLSVCVLFPTWQDLESE